jgi:hypothetical protein
MPTSHYLRIKSYLVRTNDVAGGPWHLSYTGSLGVTNVVFGSGSSLVTNIQIYNWSDTNPLSTDDFNDDPWWVYDQVLSVPDEDLTNQPSFLQEEPPEMMDHYNAGKNAHYSWTEPHSVDTESVTARTVTRLYTGGKAVAGRKSLVCINAGATEYGQPPGNGQGWWLIPGWWYATPSTPVPDSKLTVGNMQVGSDGNVWLALPDDAEQDLTVSAKDAHHYAAWATAAKYSPYINLTTATTNANLSTNVPEVCVGQQVNFSLQGLPTGSISDMVGNWTLPGKFVNESWQHSVWIRNGDGTGYYMYYGSVNYTNDFALLANTNQTSCWFYNTNNGLVSVGLNLAFSNGQHATIAAAGKISVYRPSVTFPYTVNQQIIPMLTNGYLQLGNASAKGGNDVGVADFDLVVTSTVPFTGIANWTQLIRRSVSGWFSLTQDTHGRYDLDTARFYNSNDAAIWLHTGPTASLNPWGRVTFSDSPGLPWWPSSQSIKDDFQTYLEFKPDGDGIWVTLGIVTWGWGGTETNRLLILPSTVQPYYQDSDIFPVWTQ